MDAKNILCDIAVAFAHAKLEAVMIGNAAAALQGAPVTTMDNEKKKQEKQKGK